MKSEIKLDRSLTIDNIKPNPDFVVLSPITTNHNARSKSGMCGLTRPAQPTVQTKPKKPLMDSPTCRLLG